jgi:hypothetical protein
MDARMNAVVLHGGFDGAQTAEVYAGLDVLVVPSIWDDDAREWERVYEEVLRPAYV